MTNGTVKRIKNTQPDVPDSRDWIYQPALIKLRPTMNYPDPLHILDQGTEGACTGFAVAGAINLLNRRRSINEQVSPRMLYEMAKLNDEWPGEDYSGSSIRGAIRGWKNMGVCAEKEWKYKPGSAGYLTINRAEDARRNTIGAYYRVRPRISDFHTAINESGVIAVSAHVHKGWNHPTKGEIVFDEQRTGGHAFVIVGYNDLGFWVQNSWGKRWGKKGVALWSYEDWIANVMDAWVFRLALQTPQIFGMKPESSLMRETGGVVEKKKPTIDRRTIAGHFVHIDDGLFHEGGRYWSTKRDVDQTAKLVASKPQYPHLLFYAHGGLNSPKASARRIAAMKDGYKRNGIYPFHIMYDTGLVEELKDLVFRKGESAQERVGGLGDWKDWLLEQLLRKPGTLIWDEMKLDAHDAFKKKGAGTISLGLFIKHLTDAAAKREIHLAGHSTGAVLIAHLLKAMSKMKLTIESCSLMAPACTLDLYHSHYLPVLQGKTNLKLKMLQVLNLKDRLERDDNVGKVYGKSLLYLVSNAFEDDKKEPLLGMEKFVSGVTKAKKLPVFHCSDGESGSVTHSTTHGGFDNDCKSMNHILKTVLGGKPSKPFTKEELEY